MTQDFESDGFEDLVQDERDEKPKSGPLPAPKRRPSLEDSAIDRIRTDISYLKVTKGAERAVEAKKVKEKILDFLDTYAETDSAAIISIVRRNVEYLGQGFFDEIDKEPLAVLTTEVLKQLKKAKAAIGGKGSPILAIESVHTIALVNGVSRADVFEQAGFTAEQAQILENFGKGEVEYGVLFEVFLNNK